MWFHKTGMLVVGDNGEPSVYTACAVHNEHPKLINCYCARHKKTSKAPVFHVYSMQGFQITSGPTPFMGIGALAAQSGSLALQ